MNQEENNNETHSNKETEAPAAFNNRTKTLMEASGKPTETPAEASSNPVETLAETSSNPTEMPTEASSDPKRAPAEASGNPTETPGEASSKPIEAAAASSALTEIPSEMSNKPTETPAKAFNKSKLSGKKTLKSLKAKSKMMKKSLNLNNLKAKKLKDSSQDQGKKTEVTVEAISNSADTLEEMSIKPTQSLEEVCGKPMETPAKVFNKSESSGKKTLKSLKAKSKTVKKSLDVNNLKAKKNKGGPQDRGKETEAPEEAFNNETETLMEVSIKPTETPAETSSKPTEVPAKAFNKSESSGKKSLKSLKADSEIVKCPDVNNPSQQAHGKKRRRNRGRVLQSNKERSHNEEGLARGLTLREENQSRNIMKNDHSGKRHRAQNNQEKFIESEMNQQRQKNKDSDGLERNRNLCNNKGKHAEIENNRRSEKKEKHGGLIFMCSGRTKPDCFSYRVMGISIGKKDLVLGIKPGMKLFLYDFDLKLLYGIYRASSSGGLKLEPNAFGGAFPAQVRFNVEKDCLPLPESVFKKAIKENYNERNKFKTELTIQQVRKLMKLFRPAEVHSSALSPRVARTHEKRIHKEERESLPHSHREKHARDRYANGDARTYPVLSHERDQNVAYQDVATMRREEIPRNLFITEQEYRAYGLSRKRSLTHPSHFTAPSWDPYHTDFEREHVLRHQNVIYRESVPAQKETLRADPIYLDNKEYQAYSLGSGQELLSAAPATATSAGAIDAYAKDPYYGYYQSSSSVAPQRREEVPSSYYTINGRKDTYSLESDHLLRREADQVGRLYSNYDVGPLDRQTYQAVKPEPVSMPVSYRYSFPGPAFSYR
ncbi:hypothetical protein FNV43_RR21175 [Rhamnella rubrinervis]|uniref:DCD domain-containing protein n=1 Tax=Rhamnella rubrinervis TaxID=2594499 RepID=A0A8K0E089_9ROSA|nr:hypothetical protein FNV43_RR21175 [Rhamnella rubrinervis]